MGEMFRLGGWGMYPTAMFGLILVGVACWYAVKPDKRFVPLLFSFGILTFLAGSLGFVTGVIKTLDGAATGKFPEPGSNVAMLGISESLHNLGLALALMVFAALAGTIGVWRQARRAS